MIVKATRIRACDGSGKVGAHVLAGADNESIEVLHGSPDDLKSMVDDARAVGATYGIRHVTISPEEATTREQAEQIAAMWRAEYETGDRPWLMVEHQKPRKGCGYERHWHMLVSEVDPGTGRVMTCRNSCARNEKVARLAELEFGHPLTQGRHNRAVIYALQQEGKHTEAAALRHLGEGDLPNSAFTTDAHQTAKRKGVDLAQVRDTVRRAWERSDGPQGLSAALAESGLSVQQGDKAWLVMDQAGQQVGALHRLARVKKREANSRMEETNEPVASAYAEPEASPDKAAKPAPEVHGQGTHLEGGHANGHQDKDHHRHADRPRRQPGPEPDRTDHRTPGASATGSAAPRHEAVRDREDAHRIASLRLDAAVSAAGRRDRLKALLDNAQRLTEPPADLAHRIRQEASQAASRAGRPEDANAVLKGRLRPLKKASEVAFWKMVDAEKAIEKHRASKPVGFLAAITGRTRRWRQQATRLQAQLDAAKAEHSGARDALNEASISQAASARREAMDNKRDNTAVLDRAKKLTAAAEAIEAGDRAAIAAARTGYRPALLDAGQQWKQQIEEQQKQQELKERKRLQAAKVRMPKRRHPTPEPASPAPTM